MPSQSKKDAFRRQLLAEAFPEEWDVWLSEHVAHYRLLTGDERARLQDDARIMMAEKSWEGCDGLKVTELMKLTVTAQAALLLLGLDHDYFGRVRSIVLFPAAFEMRDDPRERGPVIIGQAVDFGAVFLSWETVLAQAREPACGHNLVIHEFAHQLDFLDGYTNGAPALRNRDQTRRWQRIMQGTFQRLRRDLQEGRKTLLGSYAATNPTEFFSVASEKFFTRPAELREKHTELFDVLAEYYRVNPVNWFDGNAGAASSGDSQDHPTDTADLEVEETAPVETEGSDFVDFSCPYCHNPVSFPTPDADTLKECPNCQESMVVPESNGCPAERIRFPIRTDRLVLRCFRAADANDLAELMSDAGTLRYLRWSTMSLDDAEEWIAKGSHRHVPKAGSSCCFAVEATQIGKVVGLVHFLLVPSEFNLARFEIVISPDWHRKGYGTESVRGLLNYAFQSLHVRRVIAGCDVRNVAARRLLLKSGLRYEGEGIQDQFVKGDWVDTVRFALLRQEYQSRSKAADVPSGLG